MGVEFIIPRATGMIYVKANAPTGVMTADSRSGVRVCVPCAVVVLANSFILSATL